MSGILLSFRTSATSASTAGYVRMLCQRPEGCFLDGRAVRKGVGEGRAELDYITARFFHLQDQRLRGGQVRDPLP